VPERTTSCRRHAAARPEIAWLQDKEILMSTRRSFVLAIALSTFLAGCSEAALMGSGLKVRGFGSRVGAAVPDTIAAADAGAVIAASGAVTGPSGTLVMDFELPQRGVQSLPENTGKVIVTLSSARLANPLVQTIRREQFVGGKARMIVDKLPLGQVGVGIRIVDRDDVLATSGSATADVQANLVTPVTVNLVVREETGSVAVSVDTTVSYADTPVVAFPSAEPSATPDVAPTYVPDPSPTYVPNPSSTPYLEPTQAPVALEPVISQSQTLRGYLSTADRFNPTRTGRYKDDYTLVGADAGDTISIDMSGDFDAYLQLVDARTGSLLESDDDSGVGQAAHLEFTVMPGKRYLVRATSYTAGITGAYRLTTARD